LKTHTYKERRGVRTPIKTSNLAILVSLPVGLRFVDKKITIVLLITKNNSSIRRVFIYSKMGAKKSLQINKPNFVKKKIFGW
jgi:hypothetical protein